MENIFIPGNVPSSKNSKQWTGKMLIKNKTSRDYEKNTQFIYNVERVKFNKMIEGKEKPYSVKMHFVFKDKRRRDLHNMAQLPMDMMVKAGWIEDDDYTNVIPVFDMPEVDSKNPGLYISVC